MVLLLDDLHWADTGSLHLVRFLLPSLATRPVLVVCGWRDHEVPTGSDRDLLAAEKSPRRGSPGPSPASARTTSRR